MSQLYFLEIIYLLLGSLLFLSDAYGVKYPLLLTLRHAFSTSSRFRLALIVTGYLLVLLSIFIPYDPGPVLLGDLMVTFALLLLTIWYTLHAKQGREVLHPALERHKNAFGFALSVVAVVHFLFPMSVLL